MKKLILLILLLPLLQTKAQTNIYHPFPDSNAVWNVNTWFCCYGGCPPPPLPNPLITNSYFTYFLNGDTLINNINYNKVYKNGYSHEHCVTGGNVNNWTFYDSIYQGGLREDINSKKIYYLQPSGVNECLLYDFNLNVGDTLKDDCQLQIYGIVISIDSIMIGSAYRKKLNLSVGTPPFGLIEGIGTTGGLLEKLYDFEAGSILLCFKQNNQTLYPDTTTLCDLITSAPYVENEVQDVKIFPNPVSEEINISFNLQKPTDVKLQIYDSLGQKIKEFLEEKQTKGLNKIDFSVEDIPKGIYFLRIKIGENEITRKIVKF